MQLVVSGNRVLAHGEDCFISTGGTVVCTKTGRVFQNATVVTDCENCPTDIDSVGYEYHAGAFVPCAPFGTDDSANGMLLVACPDCATPRKIGITAYNLITFMNEYLWSVQIKKWKVSLGGSAEIQLIVSTQAQNPTYIYGSDVQFDIDGRITIQNEFSPIDSSSPSAWPLPFYMKDSRPDSPTYGQVFYMTSGENTSSSSLRRITFSGNRCFSIIDNNVERTYFNSPDPDAYPGNETTTEDGLYWYSYGKIGEMLRNASDKEETT